MSIVSIRCASSFRCKYLQLPPALRSFVTQFQETQPSRNIRWFSRSIRVRQLPQAPSFKKGSVPAANPSNPNASLRVTTPASLALKTTPTVIYEAPRTPFFTWNALATGTLFFLAGAYTLDNFVLRRPPNLPWFVPYAYGASSLLLISFGVYFVRAPHGLVKSLTVVPVRNGSRPTIKIVLREKPFIPFIKGVVKEASLQDITIGARVAGFQDPWSVLRREIREKKARQNILTRAAFSVAGSFFRILLATRRMWFREGQVKIYIGEDQFWKIDMSGWMMEDGKGIVVCSRLKF
ncbi:hypothetical protein M501DRAFT_1058814 [Patellaria atrata CBS 101060]|uniref:Uncharacterized protein n=1 Tax=Patellaria atrata CBS 101060 TaxID=1346257 RepID=A0A9P4VQ44_9PEZI|nr:hypothetical protein M501DRAFT_1058814 [Patellaria atrata CBS 101060]